MTSYLAVAAKKGGDSIVPVKLTDKEFLAVATIEQTTHLLSCSHCIGWGRRDYYMDCIVLGKTKNGKMKVIVFGSRNWAGKDHIKKIRYVNTWKLYPKKGRP